MKFGIVSIATGGQKYTKFVKDFVQTAFSYFPNPLEIFIFTDDMSLLQSKNCILMPYPNLGWPGSSLYRYHAIRDKRNFFLNSGITHLYWLDIDMIFCSPIEAVDILSDGIVSVIHPGFPDAFERRPESTAYVSSDKHPPYYTGCFQGGEIKSFLSMSGEIADQIDVDDKNKVTAIWHDESAYNHYLVNNPPARVLTPSFAYPEEHYLRKKESWWTPETIIKIRHIEKTNQGEWKNK